MLELIKRMDISVYDKNAAAAVQPGKAEKQDQLSPGKSPEEIRAEEEKVKPLHQIQEEQKEEEDSEEVTQVMLDEIANDMEILYSVGLQFAKHNDTGRTMIKVINKDTDELIREIPAKKVLDMASKMEEMIGMLFDHEA